MKKRKNKSSLEIAKNKLTKVFQLYVRYRDNWTCITCGIYIPNNTKLMHAGHYITRGNHTLLWDERNVNAQCRDCNCREFRQHCKGPYTEAFLKKYGAKTLEELILDGKKIYKPSIQEIEEKISYYEKEIERLSKIQGTQLHL